MKLLWDVGLSHNLVTSSRVEILLNALMIVPVPLLATLSGVRWSWERWTAYAFVVSGAVELFQGLALPNRSAQFADVASNTSGALAGAMLGALLARILAKRQPWVD